jgi:polyferredoxin
MATYLKRSPEKYFWAVFLAASGISLIGAMFYDLPSHVPYSGSIHAVMIAALAAIIATAIFRAVSRSR